MSAVFQLPSRSELELRRPESEPRSPFLPHPREIPIIRDETQIESMDGGKKRGGRKRRKGGGGRVEGGGEGGTGIRGEERRKATRPGEENWNPSGTEDDKIADGQVLP